MCSSIALVSVCTLTRLNFSYFLSETAWEHRARKQVNTYTNPAIATQLLNAYNDTRLVTLYFVTNPGTETRLCHLSTLYSTTVSQALSSRRDRESEALQFISLNILDLDTKHLPTKKKVYASQYATGKNSGSWAGVKLD